MPKEAKVFLAEDHDRIRKMEKMLLADQGHTVEIEATSLEEALARVKLAKKKGINVAVLDGSLSKESWKADGKIIAEALRKKVPSIKIVSCSFFSQTWGDVNLTKENLEIIAQNISGLDQTKLSNCLKSSKMLSNVQEISRIASKFVSSTPTFFVDGKQVSSSWSEIEKYLD